ncbi:glycosyltransferase family 87 protein [Actinacidiphila glaucinigra]|uniref:glycosyltransferase family 87 protein n=1 Tax=Actinacidiphila glaucinigra TaxID=235986 RepID=UPI002E306F85|nr:glycosyltransferase family 87 protein [Actinacidiphila glaucinigra]
MAGDSGKRLPVGPVLAWVATRVLLLLYVFKVLSLSPLDVTTDVSVIYHGWYEVLQSGAFPHHDVTWQYPPAAALAVLSPAILPFLDYATAFFWLACAADLVAFALLLRGSRGEGRRPAGAYVWVLGVPLLGPTAYARYDVMVTAVAVAALLATVRRPRVAGALIAFGAMLKVWPVLLLTGVRDRRIWAAAAAGAGVLALGFWLWMPGAFAFLRFQGERGTEVESLGSLVFHIARHHGWEGQVLLNYGSVEFLGPSVGLVSDIALGLTAVAFGWLLLWRLRARTYGPQTAFDAAFTAVLLFTTTSRVISPQYMIWLIGLAAVCLTLRASVMVLPSVLVLAATVLTLYEFPVRFADVVGSTDLGITLLLLRNGLLVAASVIACRRLWVASARLPSRPRRASETRLPEHDQDAEKLLTW